MDKKVIGMGIIFLILWLVVAVGVSPSICGFLSISTGQALNNIPTTSRRAIMCTGFWDPTGTMLVPFSTDIELNPSGWQGENWEGLGYDIYSYFPKPGIYTGMFEVDYQDTWEDFWNVASQLHPIAIISFGAGDGPWEIEYNARNLNSWVNDEKPPYQPTPCPPDDTQPAGYIRHSTLPVQQISDAVNNQATIQAWVDWGGNPGFYLCEYIAYLGMWYQNTHNTTVDPYPCHAAGFIHVNAGVTVEDAMQAAKITIRETIYYLSSMNIPPSKPTITGETDGEVGTSYNYTISATDADQNDVKYSIDWGDGSTFNTGLYKSGENITLSHTWASKGTYEVNVKAIDEYSTESDWATLTVNMSHTTENNKPPFASFTWTPLNPASNQTITFDASTSNDSDGSLTLYEWDWDNDGTYDVSHTTPTATHLWTQAGNYSVTLRVTDNGGVTTLKAMAVFVANVPNNPTSPKTPGFELVFLICAISVSILLYTKKRNM